MDRKRDFIFQFQVRVRVIPVYSESVSTMIPDITADVSLALLVRTVTLSNSEGPFYFAFHSRANSQPGKGVNKMTAGCDDVCNVHIVNTSLSAQVNWRSKNII